MGDNWSPLFYQQSILFKDLVSPASHFSDYRQWPTLKDYNNLLSSLLGNIQSLSGKPLSFVSQGQKPTLLQDYYEARIYLSGKIQTRIQNWHDFFQVMIWCQYSQTKSMINKMHYSALSSRLSSHEEKGKRSDVENSLTLFDECGAIIVSSNPALLQQIKDFDWPGLFIHHRDCFNQSIKCFIFGHALYEKCLNPYIGMTAHCICLTVDQNFFSLQPEQQTKALDKLAVDYFSANNNIAPSQLDPFPLLGVPGWDERNADPAFYDNKDYFRTSRRRS